MNNKISVSVRSLHFVSVACLPMVSLCSSCLMIDHSSSEDDMYSYLLLTPSVPYVPSGLVSIMDAVIAAASLSFFLV